MPAHWMPFTAHFRLHPDRSGKRWENIRDLQKLGYFIYQALDTQTDLNLALPGGGQAMGLERFSDLVYGTAVKPQFGETPPQAQITGFWLIPANYVLNPAPSPTPSSYPVAPPNQVQLIHTGQWVTGPYNQTPAVSMPDPIIQQQVKDLVTLLEDSANSGMPEHYGPVEVFRLDYANIVWGDRGHHWPR